MARRPMGGAQHARKFNKTAKQHKAINAPRRSMRGGIRL